MTDLSPYGRNLPLTGGARFIRGFKRIGLAFAGISLIVGAGAGIVAGIQQQNSKINEHNQAICIRSLAQSGASLKTGTYNHDLISLPDNGCYGPTSLQYLGVILRKAAEPTPAPLEYIIWPSAVGATIGAAIGGLLFLIFWLLGWLCAGFTRD